MFKTDVDVSSFEEVCYLIYKRAKCLKKIPFVKLCDVIADLANEYSEDNETDYLFCLPSPAGFGSLIYPHEFFLKSVSNSALKGSSSPRLLKVSFWKSIIRKFRGVEITDKSVICFASEVYSKLEITA